MEKKKVVFREPELEKVWLKVIESKAAEEIKKDW